jgi:hypothetical protein
MIEQLTLYAILTVLIYPLVMVGTMIGACLTGLAVWPFIWLWRSLRYAFRNEPIPGVKPARR